MAEWIRQGTGTAPSNTDADLVGEYALDNATAPADFDPAAVNSVRTQWTITGSGFNDDSWTNDSCALVTAGGTEISQHPSAGGANLQNESEASDHTDSTGIPTGLTIAEWEGARVRGDGTNIPNEWVDWNKVKGPDGSTLSVSALTVTIDYTPAATTRELAGTTAGAGTLSGDLFIRRVLTGSVAGVGSLSADLTAIRVLSGDVAGVGTLSGALTAVRDLSGTLAGTGTLTGDLEAVSGAKELSGTLAGTGTLSGDLVIRRALAGTLTGTSTLSGDLTAIRDLTGSVDGVGTLSGLLTIPAPGVHDMTATLAGSGTLSGALIARRALTGGLTGSGDLTGDLGAIRLLSGSVDGVGTLIGLLGVPSGRKRTEGRGVLVASTEGSKKSAGFREGSKV